jgi:hypothetical protein
VEDGVDRRAVDPNAPPRPRFIGKLQSLERMGTVRRSETTSIPQDRRAVRARDRKSFEILQGKL